MTYVELPALDMLASLLARDDDNELGNFTAIHPLLQLTHDLLDVGLDLIIGSHCEGQNEAGCGIGGLPAHHGQTIFLYAACCQWMIGVVVVVSDRLTR
jgi:hypothetical protein